MISVRLLGVLAFAVALVGCGDDDGGGATSSRAIEFRCLDVGERHVERADGGVALVPPAPVGDATDGLTVTVFPPATTSLSGVSPQITFGVRGGAPGDCIVTASNTDPRTVVAGERAGVAIVFSPADLEGFVAQIRSTDTANCTAVPGARDLVITFASATTAEGFLPLDGIAIGRAATDFPSAESDLPSCLAPGTDVATPTTSATPTVSPTATPPPTSTRCGDGIPAQGFDGGPDREECDDGNELDGDGCSATCLIEPTVIDFSSFESFELARESAFGFCPPETALFDLSAERTADGHLTLTWSVLRDATDCTVLDQTCPNRDHFSRTLTPTDASALQDAFRAVRVVERTPIGCATIAIDPCLVNAFRWDDFGANDFPCHAPLLRDDETERLLAVLDSLTHRR